MGKYDGMIPLADITDFHKGTQFFMFQPGKAIDAFIITVLCLVFGSIAWSLVAQMGDVVKVTALLRPNDTISLLKTTISGSILQKSYTHDALVKTGDLLLQIDVSSDLIELDNSKKLMQQIRNDIAVYTTLIETIRTNKNGAPKQDEEAYIRSESYIIEYKQLSSGIAELRLNLEREYSKHTSMIIRSIIEDMENEINQAELQFSLWQKNQIFDAMNRLKTFLQNQLTLERRIADLELNIKNATLYAPINGRINEIRKLNIGDRVLAGEEIISIIPENNAELKAELYVNLEYIARIKEGQKAILRFPGLPPSKFGKLESVINLIPADYTINLDSKPVFIVEAAIRKPWLVSLKGDKIYLRPGISAEGRIIIDHDTVIMMILKKLDFINSIKREKE